MSAVSEQMSWLKVNIQIRCLLRTNLVWIISIAITSRLCAHGKQYELMFAYLLSHTPHFDFCNNPGHHGSRKASIHGCKAKVIHYDLHHMKERIQFDALNFGIDCELQPLKH